MSGEQKGGRAYLGDLGDFDLVRYRVGFSRDGDFIL